MLLLGALHPARAPAAAAHVCRKLVYPVARGTGLACALGRGSCHESYGLLTSSELGEKLHLCPWLYVQLVRPIHCSADVRHVLACIAGASASFTFSTSSAPATSSFPAMTSIFQQSSQPSTSLFGEPSPQL